MVIAISKRFLEMLICEGGQKGEMESTALVVLALLQALITSYFLSINTIFDGL